MKLGKRLQQLSAMVEGGHYTHIWDCCCDHGLLGSDLLIREAAPHIHFVDIIPELMRTVEAKLHLHHSDSAAQWHVHCLDVAKLPLTEHIGKQLIIIAGVGGDRVTDLVRAIYRNYPQADIDFLLCPVHRQYSLRQQLIAFDFRLRDEILIEENKRSYEILLVSTPTSAAASLGCGDLPNKDIDGQSLSLISPVGEKIWQADCANQQQIIDNYRIKVLGYYRRMQGGGRGDLEKIIEAYNRVGV